MVPRASQPRNHYVRQNSGSQEEFAQTVLVFSTAASRFPCGAWKELITVPRERLRIPSGASRRIPCRSSGGATQGGSIERDQGDLLALQEAADGSATALERPHDREGLAPRRHLPRVRGQAGRRERRGRAAHERSHDRRCFVSETKNLAAALAEAQARAHGVEKDARNEFHKYRYASAEALISEAKEALRGTGLSLVPASTTIAPGVGVSDPTVPAILTRTFVLLHASGESRDLSFSWPIVPDRGRPFDKAVASAATASLGYLLRDLLLMPRVAEGDDMDATSRDKAREKGPRNLPRSAQRRAVAQGVPGAMDAALDPDGEGPFSGPDEDDAPICDAAGEVVGWAPKILAAKIARLPADLRDKAMQSLSNADAAKMKKIEDRVDKLLQKQAGGPGVTGGAPSPTLGPPGPSKPGEAATGTGGASATPTHGGGPSAASPGPSSRPLAPCVKCGKDTRERAMSGSALCLDHEDGPIGTRDGKPSSDPSQPVPSKRAPGPTSGPSTSASENLTGSSKKPAETSRSSGPSTTGVALQGGSVGPVGPSISATSREGSSASSSATSGTHSGPSPTENPSPERQTGLDPYMAGYVSEQQGKRKSWHPEGSLAPDDPKIAEQARAYEEALRRKGTSAPGPMISGTGSARLSESTRTTNPESALPATAAKGSGNGQNAHGESRKPISTSASAEACFQCGVDLSSKTSPTGSKIVTARGEMNDGRLACGKCWINLPKEDGGGRGTPAGETIRGLLRDGASWGPKDEQGYKPITQAGPVDSQAPTEEERAATEKWQAKAGKELGKRAPLDEDHDAREPTDSEIEEANRVSVLPGGRVSEAGAVPSRPQGFECETCGSTTGARAWTRHPGEGVPEDQRYKWRCGKCCEAIASLAPVKPKRGRPKKGVTS